MEVLNCASRDADDRPPKWVGPPLEGEPEFRSVGSAAAQQMTITMHGHPFCASEMGVEGALRASRLTNWIDVQHNLRNFAPIGVLGISIEQPQIGNEVLLVVGRQRGVGRRDIGDIWIEWRLLHRGSTQR
jgi:hypothetical protein